MKNIALMVKRKNSQEYLRHEPLSFYELPRTGEYIGLNFNNISHILKIVAIIHPISNFENTLTIDIYASEVGTEREFYDFLLST